MKRPAPDECVYKTCTRKRANPGALLCTGHWKLVPKKLKRSLWFAEHIRSPYKREFETMCAAGNILDWLEANVKIDLPPDVTIIKPTSELEQPKDALPRIITP